MVRPQQSMRKGKRLIEANIFQCYISKREASSDRAPSRTSRYKRTARTVILTTRVHGGSKSSTRRGNVVTLALLLPLPSSTFIWALYLLTARCATYKESRWSISGIVSLIPNFHSPQARSQAVEIMRDSGQGYRSEGHSDCATCTQGTSSASEYAARHRAPERIMSSQPPEDLRPTSEETRRNRSIERSAQTSFSPATDYTLGSVPPSPTGPPRARYASGHAAGVHGNRPRELSSDSALDTDSSFSSGSYHDWSDDNMDVDQEPANPSSCARGAAAPSQFGVEVNTADHPTASAQPMLRSYSNVVHGYSGTPTSPPPGAFSTRSQYDICVVRLFPCVVASSHLRCAT